MIKKYSKFIIIGLITGMVNGLFGSGGGTIIVPALVFLIGIEDHKAHATAISIIFPLTIVSTFIYFTHDMLRLNIAIVVGLGGSIGAYIGARLLNKVPSKILRKAFGIFMIIAAIRMMIK
ncbi:sulfite exporter TauE/SafE family protein [Thermohalobacter berrensis]|uniref:sulfite exporter TauE/SafE family protein n=1 Tax=Thermohalobacter berrensis TaxID=99594 RepID=UPI00242E70DB|nr:sulfite exporter TauE/SafE family protein [Thermohalobacter berrensis]